MPRAAGISPGGPGDRIWRPEQKPSQLSSRDYSTPLRYSGEDSGLFRPPYSISGASRADSSGSGHLPEQEDPMGDSGSDAGANIHASFRPLHRAAARSLRTVHRKRLFSSSRPSTQLAWTVPTGSITSHTPPINPAPRVRVSHSRVVARTRRCDCAHRTGRPYRRPSQDIYAPW
jgi:hypothetical protein